MKEPDETGTYAGDGGLSLFFQAWHPAGVPRGALINLHGLGDHGGLYPRVVEHFTAAGWAVYAPDLRGNGRSSGQRGYVERWQELRNDLRAFVALVRRGGIDRPPVVQGNSLGGLIALDYALHEPASISGVVAIAPPLGALGVPPLVLLLGRLLSQVWPRFSLEVGMDLSNLSRDPAVVAHILADPLFHRRGTARLSTEVAAAIARVQAGAANLRVPTLLLHGTADRMVSPDGSRRFTARSAGQATLVEYPGGYHVLTADLVAADVLRDVERWVDALP